MWRSATLDQFRANRPESAKTKGPLIGLATKQLTIVEDQQSSTASAPTTPIQRKRPPTAPPRLNASLTSSSSRAGWSSSANLPFQVVPSNPSKTASSSFITPSAQASAAAFRRPSGGGPPSPRSTGLINLRTLEVNSKTLAFSNPAYEAAFQATQLAGQSTVYTYWLLILALGFCADAVTSVTGDSASWVLLVFNLLLALAVASSIPKFSHFRILRIIGLFIDPNGPEIQPLAQPPAPQADSAPADDQQVLSSKMAQRSPLIVSSPSKTSNDPDAYESLPDIRSIIRSNSVESSCSSSPSSQEGALALPSGTVPSTLLPGSTLESLNEDAARIFAPASMVDSPALSSIYPTTRAAVSPLPPISKSPRQEADLQAIMTPSKDSSEEADQTQPIPPALLYSTPPIVTEHHQARKRLIGTVQAILLLEMVLVITVYAATSQHLAIVPLFLTNLALTGLAHSHATRWPVAVLSCILAGVAYVVTGPLLGWTTISLQQAGLIAFAGAAPAATVLLTLYHRELYARAKWIQSQALSLESLALEREKQRGKALLHTILPKSVANRFWDARAIHLSMPEITCPRIIADHSAEASALFADFPNSHEVMVELSPQAVVFLLNMVFSEFDALSTMLGVEKVKTIGTVYMAVSGIPDPVPNHASRLLEFAFGMQAVVKSINEQAGTNLQLRVGINSGSVVGGVIGLTKVAWDVWGDDVNIASRMMSSSIPESIQVSQAFMDALESTDGVNVACRGSVPIKGKGNMVTYFLANGLGPELPSLPLPGDSPSLGGSAHSAMSKRTAELRSAPSLRPGSSLSSRRTAMGSSSLGDVAEAEIEEDYNIHDDAHDSDDDEGDDVEVMSPPETPASNSSPEEPEPADVVRGGAYGRPMSRMGGVSGAGSVSGVGLSRNWSSVPARESSGVWAARMLSSTITSSHSLSRWMSERPGQLVSVASGALPVFPDLQLGSDDGCCGESEGSNVSRSCSPESGATDQAYAMGARMTAVGSPCTPSVAPSVLSETTVRDLAKVDWTSKRAGWTAQQPSDGGGGSEAGPVERSVSWVSALSLHDERTQVQRLRSELRGLDDKGRLRWWRTHSQLVEDVVRPGADDTKEVGSCRLWSLIFTKPEAEAAFLTGLWSRSHDSMDRMAFATLIGTLTYAGLKMILDDEVPVWGIFFTLTALKLLTNVAGRGEKLWAEHLGIAQGLLVVHILIFVLTPLLSPGSSWSLVDTIMSLFAILCSWVWPGMLWPTRLALGTVSLALLLSRILLAELAFKGTISVSAVVAVVLSASLGYQIERRQRQAVLIALAVDAKRADLQDEGACYNDLLLSIFPRKIAGKLKEAVEGNLDALKGVELWESVESAIVVQADIVGFTKLCSTLRAGVIVRMLNELFSNFDALAEANGLDKIKTIGDAYRAVGWLANASEQKERVNQAIAFGMGMLSVVQELNERHGTSLAIRVGIACGAAVSGVIGTKKLAHDMWGPVVDDAGALEAGATINTILLQKSLTADVIVNGSMRLIPRRQPASSSTSSSSGLSRVLPSADGKSEIVRTAWEIRPC